ncbi:MAG: hypothetical protein WBA61_01895, partial [Aequorivita sp.]
VLGFFQILPHGKHPCPQLTVLVKISPFGTLTLEIMNMHSKQKEELINALQKGERSGFITDFNRSDFLNKIHEKNTSK